MLEYDPYYFAQLRHVGPSLTEIDQMLETIGFESVDELVSSVLPPKLLEFFNADPLSDQLGKALTEDEVLTRLRVVSLKNTQMTSLIGMGYYGTFMPPVIQRNILENPAWYTAYTPYQSEISQGRLEMLMNFQTMICDLTGMEVANASLLDEATACAEGMALARRVSRSENQAFFVHNGCHPQNISVIKTRADPLGISVIVGSIEEMDPDALFGALFQYPETFGDIRDLSEPVSQLKSSGALSIVSADLLSLALLKEPGAMGADICVGSTQRFGTPPGFGGPHAAYFATQKKYIRQIPGRIVGISKDSRGNQALRLALQTREQHIRRQRATSNICTAQVLPAILSTLYGVFHGPPGLIAIAHRVHTLMARLRSTMIDVGYSIPQKYFFDTITVNVGNSQKDLLESAHKHSLNFRKIGNDRIGLSFDELTSQEIINKIASVFGFKLISSEQNTLMRIPDKLRRQTEFMSHPVFNMNRSEAGITRYMRRLADRDLALDRTMIPLGSCTMKLNATSEMIPISWPEFSQMHPYVPQDQASGFYEMINDLSERLALITGFDAISFQPNSGAQGEYAGLLAIRAYHKSCGGPEKNLCLIPKSAHGTNAASASMAGMDVIEIDTKPDGTIDLVHLQQIASENRQNVAVTMVTYPSTHGVFEESITDVIRITHSCGGQVYMDGANLNALVGLIKPGKLGVDVCHLNLHKTFCIPHGGGGPGMGPIGVQSHLVPFLPGDPVSGENNGAVSAANHGSASILAVSWAYILLMAGQGLTLATKLAILNANYIAKRLSEQYEICYSGREGLVAHECIIDTRKSVHGTTITVDDIAKRIIDNGIHPPTMSFPVAGTLMIEPTESEPLEELNRFIDCMLEIADEIKNIKCGKCSAECNPLVNSPHTVADIIGEWKRAYTRKIGCMPAGTRANDKYWPPVNRVDNVYGERNLVCVWKN